MRKKMRNKMRRPLRRRIVKNKKETNPEDNFVLKFSPEEINEMLPDYSDEEQKN